VVKALRYQSEGPRIDPGRGDFFRGTRKVHVPGVDSAFRNEYQDIPGGKNGRCVGLTLPPLFADVYKSGSLNLSDSSRSCRPVSGLLYLLPTASSVKLLILRRIQRDVINVETAANKKLN
jgi:hypothetical protein